MRFFKKVATSEILIKGLKYSEAGQRPEIRKILIKEQKGFCAYSERYIKNTDSVDIEHFDPEKKNTILDGYYNWYATLHWMNSHKPNLIQPYLPILNPYLVNPLTRIEYKSGQFAPKDSADIEAQNLIDFLGVNKYEVSKDRQNHLNRIKSLEKLCNNDDLFIKKMIEFPENLSFATALREEFYLDIDDLIAQAINL